jgi:hypothetical protein
MAAGGEQQLSERRKRHDFVGQPSDTAASNTAAIALDVLLLEEPCALSWSWLFGQFGSGVKVYSGC